MISSQQSCLSQQKHILYGYPRHITGTLSIKSRRRGRFKAATALLEVDWRRYHQNILFVSNHSIRARFAVGILERIIEWNGWGRIMIAMPCATEAAASRDSEPAELSIGQQVALMALAEEWRLRPRLFIDHKQVFEPDDVDKFDIICAIDQKVYAQILQSVSAERPAAPGSYLNKVCCLTDFLMYSPEERLLQEGGSGLLDRRLRQQVREHLPALRPSPSTLEALGVTQSVVAAAKNGKDAIMLPHYLLPDLTRPSLQESPRAFDRMLLLLTVCCAGLCECIIDVYPTDLKHWEDEE